MSAVDLVTVASHVRTILTAPPKDPPLTGDAALDKALAVLAQQRRAGRPLGELDLGYWGLRSRPAHAAAS